MVKKSLRFHLKTLPWGWGISLGGLLGVYVFEGGAGLGGEGGRGGSLLAGTDWFGITLGETDAARSGPRVDIRFN